MAWVTRATRVTRVTQAWCNGAASMSAAADKALRAGRLLAPIKARWAGIAPREQRLLLGAAVALLLLLVWLLALQPALRTLATAPAQRDALDAQLQQMQRLAAEAGQLRSAPRLSPEQSLSALAAATERLGDKARLSVQGDRAVLTLQNVGTGALRDWLAEARSAARAQPVEASLSRGAEGYSGTLIVAVGGTL